MELKNQMVNQLLDAIDGGHINEETIGNFSYYQLALLMEMTMQIENGKAFYIKIKSYLENINIQRMKKQEKITVGFIANYSSTWIGDELYRLLEKSERFEPYIFVISNHNGQSEELVKQEYEKNLEFFQARNLRVVQTLNIDTGEQYTWNEIGFKPEVCIWLTSWIDLFKDQFYLLNYSLDTLHTYIPYGVMIAENESENFVYQQYNKFIHNISWKNFELSKIAIEMAKKYSFIEGVNSVYSGYPKMDSFYEEQDNISDNWSRVIQKAGNPNAKKIIYAPHHTLDETEPVHFSTFASNYMYMLELAEKYQDETVWVFKPHPQLKYKAIKAGIFSDIYEWEAYEQKWKRLKNADVIEEGMYNTLFCNSDAMILDSVSFLAEYLYVHKPLLFLKRSGQFFNNFGKELIKIHYNVDGTDFPGIERFVLDIILNDNDVNKEDREQFFREKMDYVHMTGKNASANIFEQILNGFK